MLQELQDLINKLGRIPSSSHFDSSKVTNSSGCYWKYFGGIDNAILQLGYIPFKKSISLHLSNDDIENIYKDFIDKNGYVPTFDYGCKIYSLPSPSTVLRRFNCTWNEFIQSIGYKPNESMFGNTICYAKDGTQCLSNAECIIHNYLLTLNINNLQKEVFYVDFIDDEKLYEICKTKRCDWTFKYNNKLYILEYFGCMGFHDYSERHDIKIDLITRDNKLDNFIPLYPKHLKHLEDVFSFIK